MDMAVSTIVAIVGVVIGLVFVGAFLHKKQLAAAFEKAELRGGFSRQCGNGLVGKEVGHAVEDPRAFPASHSSAARRKLGRRDTERRRAHRAAGHQAHRRVPVSSTQPSSRCATSTLKSAE